jgi:succinate dehydrogenase/fumarate reductase-like Fe-S protein
MESSNSLLFKAAAGDLIVDKNDLRNSCHNVSPTLLDHMNHIQNSTRNSLDRAKKNLFRAINKCNDCSSLTGHHSLQHVSLAYLGSHSVAPILL